MVKRVPRFVICSFPQPVFVFYFSPKFVLCNKKKNYDRFTQKYNKLTFIVENYF